MTLRQSKPISPPRPGDEELLLDYSAILQDGFDELFEAAHTHPIRTTQPASNEGSLGDIILVETVTEKYITVKYSSGWFRTATLTAL